MNMDTLSIVKFGDTESLNEFMFENGLQHNLFRQIFMDAGVGTPAYPLMDLDLNNPFNMLDVDFNNESDFYDWLASHLYIHEQIASSLGLS